MTVRFRGVIPPVVTPLTAEGEFDSVSFERSLNRMIDAGVHGVFVLGSSGEVVFTTDERRREIIKTAVEIVDGRVPVLVGVIDTATPRVIAHAKVAKELGADAIVATAPFYALIGQDDVERHFRLIREAVDLPLFAYDIPVCVHIKLEAGMLLRLAKDGVLDGLKDSSGDDVSFRDLSLKRTEENIEMSLLSGHEVVVDGAYMSHADGSVPGLANVDPWTYVKQWEAAQKHDWDRVLELQDQAARLMRITSVTDGVVGYGGGVGAFKTALMLLGVFDSNKMPDPIATLEGKNVTAIAEVLRQTGLLKDSEN